MKPSLEHQQPPLPKPLTLSRGDEDGPIQLGYTADQMREYARQVLDAERKAFADELAAEMTLDGFGCACEPSKQCGTCRARDVLTKALSPMLRRLRA